jgi:hypothetical protein
LVHRIVHASWKRFALTDIDSEEGLWVSPAYGLR